MRFRWVLMGGALVAGGWVLRLAQAEREAQRRLAAPTTGWPSLAGAGLIDEGGDSDGAPGPSSPVSSRGDLPAEPDPAPPPPPASAAAWVPATAGACPSTHPVKAKIRSRVFRPPGTAGYDRVAADRCYYSVEDAEADGFHRARS